MLFLCLFVSNRVTLIQFRQTVCRSGFSLLVAHDFVFLFSGSGNLLSDDGLLEVLIGRLKSSKVSQTHYSGLFCNCVHVAGSIQLAVLVLYKI